MLTSVILFFAVGGMFQRATVVQMDLTNCVAPAHSIISTLAATNEAPQHDVCAEYVLASPTVVFRVQAKKSETLMVPGEVVSYRAGKGKLFLRRDDDGGDLESTVLCMRSTSADGDACGLDLKTVQTEIKRTARARIP